MRRICVYCGSQSGQSGAYSAAARQLAAALTERHLGLVYGGASIGVMGALADAVLAAGGEVDGVIPNVLTQREIVHNGLSKLHLVDSMHQRKALMNDLADGFIALPGGFGTFEELFEIITWAQLGLHSKPIGVLNIDGFYDSLLQFLRQTVDAGFIRAERLDSLLIATTPATLLDDFARFTPPPAPSLGHAAPAP